MGWEDTIQPVKAGSWEDTIREVPPEPGMLDKAKSYLEDDVIDQLPALGATVGGIGGGLAGAAVGGVGAVPGGLSGAAAGGALGTATQNLYNRYVRPEKDPKTQADVLIDPVKGAVEGAAAQALGEGLGAAAGKVFKGPASKVAGYLREKAAKLTETATGATGPTVYKKFPARAGHELLDRGIVGFGDTQKSIAKKATAALDASGKQIGSALEGLDAKGGQVSRDEIIADIQAQIADLKNKPSQADIRRRLETSLEDILAGPENYSLSAAEAEKRGYQGKVNYLNPTPKADKAMASAFQERVEQNATALDPNLAGQFQTGKKDYGLLAPIAEAAEKRAATDSQRMGVNLHSLGHGAVGSLIGGEEGYRHGGISGGIAGAAAGALIGPRAVSSGAASANWLSGVVRSAPDVLGKFAPVLTQAAQRGMKELMFTDKILRETDPEYRQKLTDIESGRGTASN